MFGRPTNIPGIDFPIIPGVNAPPPSGPVESLTGMLIGPTLAKNIPDMFAASQDALPQQISHFVIAIDAAKLSVDGNTGRTAEFADEVKAAGGRLPGSNRVNPEKLVDSDEITITDQVFAQLGF